MSPAALVALRTAATLAHVLPTLRLRVRHGSETVLEVAHAFEGDRTVEGERPVVSPCAFRRAVAVAHEQAKQGHRSGLVGLPPGAEPVVLVGVRSGDAVLPGGVYRVAVGESTIHGFTTTLTPRRCRDVLEARTDSDALVRLHRDAATEVTFVHSVHPTADAPLDGAHLTPALEAIFAEEVVRELAVPV